MTLLIACASVNGCGLVFATPIGHLLCLPMNNLWTNQAGIGYMESNNWVSIIKYVCVTICVVWY